MAQDPLIAEELRRLDSHGAGNIRVHSDLTLCRKCGKVWDTNDPVPPYCGARVYPINLMITLVVFVAIALVLALAWLA